MVLTKCMAIILFQIILKDDLNNSIFKYHRNDKLNDRNNYLQIQSNSE